MMLSKFMTKSKLQSLSVRTRIIIGFGLILILTLITAVIGYVSLRALQDEVETTFASASRIRELGVQIENEFLLARQSESDFIANWRTIGIGTAVTKHAQANEQSLQKARTDLAELDALAQASDNAEVQLLLERTAQLETLLDEYEVVFKRTVNTSETLSQAEGTEAILKDTLNRLEVTLQPLANTEFYRLILQIRSNERSYFGTTQQQYVDAIRLLSGRFVALVKDSSTDELIVGGVPIDADGLIDEIVSYQETFAQLVRLENDIKTNTTAMQDTAQDINEITRQIGEDGEVAFVTARARLDERSQRSTGFLVVTAVLALSLSVITALVLGRQITLPLTQLSQAAERIGQGDLEQQVTVSGGQELTTLASAFNSMTAQLRHSITNLEDRVTERTRAIETSAKISRQLSTILDPKQLATTVVDQLKSAFDYYHVHIYLFDEAQEHLLMVGGTGEAGQQMLAQEHKIAAGQGLVGRAATTNVPILVPDVSKEAGWLPNPLLPETKAETAVPIAIGEQVLGVLDVQHNRVDGLGEQDITLLHAIANQVAIALQNTRIYQQSQHLAEQEAVTNSIRQQLDRADTVEDVLQVAVRELGRALGAEETRIRLQTETTGGNGRV
jgi:nitrogen fixation/metabolism regulation signal transduction histidine kinase